MGSPYCQAFVSWILGKAGNKNNIKTGLASKFKIKNKSFSAFDVMRNKIKVEDGDVLTWQKGRTIYGHAGFSTENWEGMQGMTIQANTKSVDEERDGDGIFIKKARIEPYNYFRIVRITKVNE